MSGQLQKPSSSQEAHNDFCHASVKKIHILDSFLSTAIDVTRKALHQTEIDIIQSTAAYQEERHKTEELSMSNSSLCGELERAHRTINALRVELESANQIINRLDSQLYENGPGEFDRHMTTELDETHRLVEQLENEVFQLKRDKLQMQLEHDQDIDSILQRQIYTA